MKLNMEISIKKLDLVTLTASIYSVPLNVYVKNRTPKNYFRIIYKE